MNGIERKFNPGNVVDQARRRKVELDLLRRREVYVGSLGDLSGSGGRLDEDIELVMGEGDMDDPENPFSGRIIVYPPLEVVVGGETFLLTDVGMEDNELTFGLSAGNGSAIFMGGQAVIGRTGIRVNGLNVPYTHTAESSGGTVRTGVLRMRTFPAINAPCWSLEYKRPIAAADQINVSTVWATEHSYISAGGQAVTIITNEIAGGDSSVLAVSERLKTYPGAEHTFGVTVRRGLTQYTPDCNLSILVYWYNKSGEAFAITEVVSLANGNIPATPTVYTKTVTADDRAERFEIRVSATHDYSGYNQSILITGITANRLACEEIQSLAFMDWGATFENTPIFMEKLVSGEFSLPAGGYGSVYMLTDGELYVNPGGLSGIQVGETIARSLLFLKGI